MQQRPRRPRYPTAIRRPRQLRVEVTEERRRRPLIRPQSAPLLLVGAFALAIAIGTLLLSLPLSSADREWTPLVTALFTSTSAVCVTGLVVVDTGTYWSGFGHVVILALMQIGGLGFMTGAILLFLLFGWRVGMRERTVFREAMDLGRISGVVEIARRIVIFVLAVEAVGFVVLTVRFAFDEPLHRAAWWGLFHSVSGFNNAGFDLFGEFRSLRDHADAVTLMTISSLFVLGALGYLVFEEIRRRRKPGLSIDSRLILVTTLGLLAVGLFSILALEWRSTLDGMSVPEKVLNSWFHSATRTAGFSTVPVGEMNEATQFLNIALMFIGGASGSTAGGIKVGTFALLVLLVWATASGRQQVEAFGREVRRGDVDRALAVALLAIAFVFSIVMALSLTEEADFMSVLFEATSAFGTVGLSTGITPDLSTAGQLIVVLAMFIGRLGPLTLVLALAVRRRIQRRRLAEDRVRIG
jgi:trk system potassium uptake protein